MIQQKEHDGNSTKAVEDEYPLDSLKLSKRKDSFNWNSFKAVMNLCFDVFSIIGSITGQLRTVWGNTGDLLQMVKFRYFLKLWNEELL